MCNVKVKKTLGYTSAYSPSDPLHGYDLRNAGRSHLDSYEMEVYFPSSLHVRLMEDPRAHELRQFGKPGECERYIADRLRHQMLDFINGQIQQQVAAIAKANRPPCGDDMQFLFKESK